MQHSPKKRILCCSATFFGAQAVPFWMNRLTRVACHAVIGRPMAAAEGLIRRVIGKESPHPTFVVTTSATTARHKEPIAGTAEVNAISPKQADLKLRRSAFTRQVFEFEGEHYGFNLYVPPLTPSTSPLEASAMVPLVVMLHGCKQDAPDFARGTALNELAAKTPCMVLYPEQRPKANQMRCWNWFDSAHQGRHAGEPAMLAALTRQVISRYPVDPTRVYVAGLSAGGAMAAIVSAHYPDLFAAVGVHSGLPPGAAHDVMSAFSAMRHGGLSSAPGEPAALKDVMPTIVFHGSSDRTVHPDNGDQIVLAAIAALKASGVKLKRSVIPEQIPAPTGELRHTLRTVYSTLDQRSYVEHWSVEAGPHAWSGGSAAGSFTDPHGPDASTAMLTFFLQHHR
jgi:poly(hydroxyalkanoate) depolymerase family esterase